MSDLYRKRIPMTLEESIAAASGLYVTSEGYRQLRAAYDDPSHASFTADAFSSHSAANPAVMARHLELIPSDEYDDETDVDDDIAMKQEHEAPGTEPKDAPVRPISSRKVLLKEAPSMALDVCVLGDLPVTLDELAAFFPLHYNWPAYLVRFSNAGWRALAISRLMGYLRNEYTDAHLVNFRSNLGHKLPKAKIDVAAAHFPVDYSLGSWRSPADLQPDRHGWKKGCLPDMRLMDLGNGLKHFPEGKGRRHLTLAVELARERGDSSIMLTGLAEYIKDNRIGEDLAPIDADGDPDREAWVRLRNIIDPKKYGEKMDGQHGIQVHW